MDFFHVIDTHFLGYKHAIAVYALPHTAGLVLIESGPGSTLDTLQKSLDALGYPLKSITDIFLTHIHLDHAGSVGALAKHGARIHVHPNGAPHLINPEKLLASAGRIYGDQMERLWGKFLPVPESQLSILSDRQEVTIGNLSLVALDTPGHAEHHFAYLVQDTCFTGDIGGIRLPGSAHLRLPMPPPELNLEKWRRSLMTLREVKPKAVAPTHFGAQQDPRSHLDRLEKLVDEIDAWISKVMPSDPPVEEIDRLFHRWTEARSTAEGLTPDLVEAYEAANPTWMSAAGIQRYWRKFRASIDPS